MGLFDLIRRRLFAAPVSAPEEEATNNIGSDNSNLASELNESNGGVRQRGQRKLKESSTRNNGDGNQMDSILPATTAVKESENELPDVQPSSIDEHSESTHQASQKDNSSINIEEESKTPTRTESRKELTTPILREQSNKHSNSGSFAIGDMLWVTQGKTEHLAIFVDESSHYRNDEILVRWAANNLTDYVPISSVKPLGGERRSRRQTQAQEIQHGRYNETNVIGRKRKRAESTTRGNAASRDLQQENQGERRSRRQTQAQEIQHGRYNETNAIGRKRKRAESTTRGNAASRDLQQENLKSKSTTKSSQSSSSSEGSSVYAMDVVSAAIINTILQKCTVKEHSNWFRKAAAKPTRCRIRIRENDVLVGSHRIKGHKGNERFKTIIHLFKNSEFDRRRMSFRRILVIASELFDFIDYALHGRFMMRSNTRRSKHRWIVLSRAEATRIIRKTLCHSIGVKSGIAKRRKRMKKYQATNNNEMHGVAPEIIKEDETNEASPEMVISSEDLSGEISSLDMQHTGNLKSEEKSDSSTERDLVPTSLDVICGEISPLEMPNDGNCFFRSQLSSMTEAYYACTSGAEKMAIARRILAGVWRSGGRFLVQTKNGGWREMEGTESLVEIRKAFLQQKQNSSSEVWLV